VQRVQGRSSRCGRTVRTSFAELGLVKCCRLHASLTRAAGVLIERPSCQILSTCTCGWAVPVPRLCVSSGVAVGALHLELRHRAHLADDSVCYFDDPPCCCYTALMRYCGFLRRYVWILVTPIWCEVGLYGVDNRHHSHIASARIGHTQTKDIPLHFLERKLGRALSMSNTPLRVWDFIPFACVVPCVVTTQDFML
jgi:hypothetical protein